MKKILMMAAMALLCLTANAQKARHLPGDITVQPMIGVSEGFLSGKYNNFSFRSDDPRTGLTIGAEGEYFTNTRNLSLTAGLLYTQEGWMAKGSGPQTTKLNFHGGQRECGRPLREFQPRSAHWCLLRIQEPHYPRSALYPSPDHHQQGC